MKVYALRCTVLCRSHTHTHTTYPQVLQVAAGSIELSKQVFTVRNPVTLTLAPMDHSQGRSPRGEHSGRVSKDRTTPTPHKSTDSTCSNTQVMLIIMHSYIIISTNSCHVCHIFNDDILTCFIIALTVRLLPIIIM